MAGMQRRENNLVFSGIWHIHDNPGIGLAFDLLGSEAREQGMQHSVYIDYKYVGPSIDILLQVDNVIGRNHYNICIVPVTGDPKVVMIDYLRARELNTHTMTDRRYCADKSIKFTSVVIQSNTSGDSWTYQVFIMENINYEMVYRPVPVWRLFSDIDMEND